MGIPLAFYTKMCFASCIYLKPHRLFDVTQLCRKTRRPSGLNCVIGYPCVLISRIDGAIRNITTNVASMFTRTCRLFSIVVTSPKYTFVICTLVTGATLHDLSKFYQIYGFQQAKPFCKLTIRIGLVCWNRKI